MDSTPDFDFDKNEQILTKYGKKYYFTYFGYIDPLDSLNSYMLSYDEYNTISFNGDSLKIISNFVNGRFNISRIWYEPGIKKHGNFAFIIGSVGHKFLEYIKRSYEIDYKIDKNNRENFDLFQLINMKFPKDIKNIILLYLSINKYECWINFVPPNPIRLNIHRKLVN